MSTTFPNENTAWQGGVGRADKTKFDFSSRSTETEAQIKKMLALLRDRPRHTHELRKLGISHPAGRIGDLKKRGCTIGRQSINTVDSDGFSHINVALYSLISEPEEMGLRDGD